MRRLFAIVLLFTASIAAGEPLRVSAAASLTDVLQEIARGYGQPVLFNFGGSSLLVRQIEEGAPADVIISADELQIDRLAARGLIVKTSRADLLSNTLVIVVPADSRLRVLSPRDLVGRPLAIAQPDSVPAGVYAKSYLERLKLWSAIAKNVVPMENVRAVLAAVESGNVEAGIVYKTDALSSRAVKITYEVPRAQGPRIIYPAAVLAGSTQKAAAQKFLIYLRSDAARRVFRRYGYLLP